ncbi:Probable protein phosphatase 2C 38 [Linum perenne]
MRIVSNCWRPLVDGESNKGGNATGRADGLLWYKDSGRHVNGKFSMALIQANNLLEDQCQLESGPQGTFVGVYDGHGGPEAARFVNERIFDNIKTFLATDEEFLFLVKNQWLIKPQIASVGACCLVGIVCNGLLYIANVGDSRAVLGRLEKNMKKVKAIQLSSEHNASIVSVRDELQALHPDDPHIVVLKHKVWRVRGLIQVSRSLGDAYLKRVEFNREPLLEKFRLPQPFERPILLAEPTITVQRLLPQDLFLIFASDGLWEHLTNQEAINIVHNCPRNGVARKLLKAALREAAKKREMRYSDLEKIDRGLRRHFHDDITVIVLFLDSHMISRSSCRSLRISIRGGGGVPRYRTKT